MDKQKQIEEMARKLCKSSSNGCNFPTCSKCGIKDTCKALTYATRAVNAGYGNLKEFAERYKNQLKDIVKELDAQIERFRNEDQEHMRILNAKRNRILDDLKLFDNLLKEYLNG